MNLRFDRSFDAPYGEEQRLSPLVTRVLAPNPGPFTFRGTGVHIVGGGDGVAVIDPGPDLPEHLEALKRAIGARRVSHVLVTHTHADHSPAAAPLKAWSGAPTYGFAPASPLPEGAAHVDEAHDHAFVPDMVVTDGMRIDGDGFSIACVHTPGHTANHVCYALEEEKALFSGDHVMGWSTSVIAPPDGDMGDYLASLEKLIARGDRLLYPTHGAPIADPLAHMRGLLEHRRMREAQIAAALADGPATAIGIAARLYPDIDPLLRAAAATQVTAHLRHLAGQGRVERVLPPDGCWRLDSGTP